jgi:WD40 repeat protein
MMSDAAHVATGSEDRTIRIWSLPHGQCRAVIEGHADQVGALAATPNCRFIVASEQSMVRVWELDWDFTFSGEVK